VGWLPPEPEDPPVARRRGDSSDGRGRRPRARRPLDDELALLVARILHLLNYDHAEEREGRRCDAENGATGAEQRHDAGTDNQA
jgi:hypothetical protein